jgi:soluble lytic murein transglycosylase
MAYRAGDSETAAEDWMAVADGYPSSDWSAPALLWLVRTLPPEEAPAYYAQAAALPPDSYYAIRAADLVSAVLPFERPASIVWPEGEVSPPEPWPRSADQEEAEAWLREWLGLDPELEVSAPSFAITADPRWERGRRLWALGLAQEAKVELNGLRYDLSWDALASYQLALAFRDIGLYRSSILAASTVIRHSPANTPLEAPPFLARLAYPAYYRGLVEAAASEHDLDPLLLLAMIRQESLFESFARSWAAAQGLMQVIPTTGEYIASQLDWPDYRNESLYLPFVSIPFGAYYIAAQLEAFDGNTTVALSAYNAGPGNAFRWYQLAPDNQDLYLEIITLSEPRRYIRSIYTHYTYYRVLYGFGDGEGR